MTAIHQIPDHNMTTLLEQAAYTANRWMDENAVRQAQQDIQQRSQQASACVMLFGNYSAGKSTLINALLGNEKAPHGQTPTTDTVDEYRWGDIVLQDTPGVNAPVQHEETTRDALVKADMVLCVIRAGDHDTLDVYRRLLALIADDKPVMVVLNHEIAADKSASDLTDIHRAVTQHLLQLAPEYGVDQPDQPALDRLEVFPVQCLSAMNAAIQGKQALLSHAGLPVLRTALQHWVAGSAALQGRLQATAASIQNALLQPALSAIADVLPDGESPQLEEAHRRLRELRNQKAQLRARVSAEAGRLAALSRGALTEVYKCSEAPAQQVVLENVYQDVQQQTFSYMLSLLPELEDVLVSTTSNLAIDNTANGQDTKNQDTLGQLTAQMRQWLPDVPEDALSNLINTILTSQTSTVLKPLQTLLRGSFGQFLKANSRYLGPAITGVVGIAETFYASKAEERENAARRAEEQRRQQQLTGWVEQISRSVSDAVNAALDQCLEPHIQQQRAALEALENNAAAAETDKQALLDIKAALVTLQAQ